MPESTNPRPMGPPSLRGRSECHDTVLLTDTPEPNAPLLGTAARVAPHANVGSSSLEALGQRYDILGEAGHGSMGNVYKARDRETGEVVALKLLKPEIASDQAMMERFKNELLFARKITHKNVCRVYDFNRVGGIAYTSMEFVEGESLRSVLNRFGGLPVRKGVNVALQICSGLKEAHAQGIVHRDLKPENVMIDASGNVKIMDFGIARSMEATTRLTGSMVGTPAYMAPEQVSGKPVDYRSDVYSLGLILYEMFTGSQALQADTPLALALKQLRETPPPPHEIDPTIPVPIERAILKCLEKEPSKRFQSVADLERALSAPGATGSSPGLAPFAPAHVPTPAPASLPHQVDTPLSSSLSAAVPKQSHISPLIWVLVGAAIVIVALAGSRWIKVSSHARQIPPPPALPAPKPPELALTAPAAAARDAAPDPGSEAGSAETTHETPADSSNAVATTPAGKKALPPTKAFAHTNMAPAAPSPAKPSGADIFPRVEVPVKKSARQIELEKAPADVQQRADKAFGEKPSSTREPPTSYLWVGRYERQDRAQDVVQKIKSLGLPARTLPRHGLAGEFWIVVTGPFEAKRVSDVTQWLEAQGYRNVHPLEIGGGRQVSRTKPE